MGTQLRELSKSFPMNTIMARFRWFKKLLHPCALDESSHSIGMVNARQAKWLAISFVILLAHVYILTGVQLDTSPIANGYRKLSWAITIFAFVARLAIRKVKF